MTNQLLVCLKYLWGITICFDKNFSQCLKFIRKTRLQKHILSKRANTSKFLAYSLVIVLVAWISGKLDHVTSEEFEQLVVLVAGKRPTLNVRRSRQHKNTGATRVVHGLPEATTLYNLRTFDTFQMQPLPELRGNANKNF